MATPRKLSVVVKRVAQHQPVPPENKSGFPFMPVRFTDLTVTPWGYGNGAEPKIAHSLRASDFTEATATPSSREQGKAA